MKILKFLLSKRVRMEYSKKVTNDYNEISNKTAEIYLQAINEYDLLKEQVA